MRRILAAACAAFLFIEPGDARVRIDGPPIDLPEEIARDAQVDVVRMTTNWIEAGQDFSDTFDWQVGAHLRQCATGKRKLTLRTHIRRLDKEDPIGRLFDRGEHVMQAAAELVDRKTKTVVARYYFDLGVESGGFLKALVADPELMLSEAYGKQLCRVAFAPTASRNSAAAFRRTP